MSVPSTRSTHDLVALDGFVFAVGGNDGSASLSSVERYEPRGNRWITLPAMLTRR